MQQRFFRTIPARLRAIPKTQQRGEKTWVSSISQVLTRVINKRDEAHCDFLLDFRSAITHCHLVQRNNVT
jgi:hypothetical protein